MVRFVTFFVRRVVVEGDSMAPNFVSGEYLTAFRRWRQVRVGDVVVLPDPRGEQRWLLKRCVAVDGSRIELRGDNPESSTDSRHFGPVARRSVTYLIVAAKHS